MVEHLIEIYSKVAGQPAVCALSFSGCAFTDSPSVLIKPVSFPEAVNGAQNGFAQAPLTMDPEEWVYLFNPLVRLDEAAVDWKGMWSALIRGLTMRQANELAYRLVMAMTSTAGLDDGPIRAQRELK